MPPKRVGFLRRFGLKTGIDFDHFGLESGTVFKGTTGVYERIFLFQFQMSKKERGMRIRNSFLLLFYSKQSDYLTARPGLKTGVKNDIFWSEIGSGFKEPDRPPPPTIQLEQKAEFEKEKVASPSKQNVKLPKLVLTKYNGALENWLAFWNKFEAEIDETGLPAVTKFAYLKELVKPRVRKGIDSLPFTSEGYERAKNFLQTNYGQTSEIINAYAENIQGLPVISGTHPAKIHDFFETFPYNVQSLETLGKTSDCKALVRGVLNKLPGIKAELVQGKSDWKTWDFTQLINALREWKEIHPREIEKSCDRSFYVEDQDPNAPRGCVSCNNTSHKHSDCTVISSAADRKKFLQEKRLCF